MMSDLGEYCILGLQPIELISIIAPLLVCGQGRLSLQYLPLPFAAPGPLLVTSNHLIGWIDRSYGNYEKMNLSDESPPVREGIRPASPEELRRNFLIIDIHKGYSS